MATISAKYLGYDVYVVMDASGTYSYIASIVAATRMGYEGIKMVTWDYVGCELLVDWRNEEGEEYGNIVEEALPVYGFLAEA
jgi:hypothetical protein